MKIYAFDPGAITGLATLENDTITDLRALAIANVPAHLRTLPRPDLVAIETPSHAGSSWSMDSYGTLREEAGRLVGICEDRWPGVEILRPWPQPHSRKGRIVGESWQPWAHEGFTGDAKDKSLQRVLSVERACEIPRSKDAWDAGAILCWARWGR